jgi:hypothetical protein
LRGTLARGGQGRGGGGGRYAGRLCASLRSPSTPTTAAMVPQSALGPALARLLALPSLHPATAFTAAGGSDEGVGFQLPPSATLAGYHAVVAADVAWADAIRLAQACRALPAPPPLFAAGKSGGEGGGGSGRVGAQVNTDRWWWWWWWGGGGTCAQNIAANCTRPRIVGEVTQLGPCHVTHVTSTVALAVQATRAVQSIL